MDNTPVFHSKYLFDIQIRNLESVQQIEPGVGVCGGGCAESCSGSCSSSSKSTSK